MSPPLALCQLILGQDWNHPLLWWLNELPVICLVVNWSAAFFIQDEIWTLWLKERKSFEKNRPTELSLHLRAVQIWRFNTKALIFRFWETSISSKMKSINLVFMVNLSFCGQASLLGDCHGIYASSVKTFSFELFSEGAKNINQLSWNKNFFLI